MPWISDNLFRLHMHFKRKYFAIKRLKDKLRNSRKAQTKNVTAFIV